MKNSEIIAQALKDAGIADANPAAFKSRTSWLKEKKVPKEDATPLRVKLWCGFNGNFITKWTDLYGPDQVEDIANE